MPTPSPEASDSGQGPAALQRDAPVVNDAAERGIRAAQLAMLVNAGLAIAKLAAGLLGSTYALVADAVESTADIFSSSVVWGSLKISARDPDEEYPFGYGKAEPLAAAVVALLIIVAAIGIAIQAIREIRTPHQSPAPWTLLVLVVVVAIKFALSRRVQRVGADIGSTAVKTDAWHHMSDAVTSAAAFVGISIALLAGPGWESADDWAALLASAIIAYNGYQMLQPGLHDLMDRAPGPDVYEPALRAARSVAGVHATEKLAIRKSGLGYRITIHVQADPSLRLDEAHILSGKVKSAIKAAVPHVQSVLVHMEPFSR
jgi:cation diffusion facilitator family transporter